MGTLALVTAAVAASLATAVAVGASLGAAAANNDHATRTRPSSDRLLLMAAAVALWGAVAMVVVDLLTVDTSSALVVAHTRPGLGPARRIMGLWGGSAGSLLLFGAVLAAALAAVPTRRSTAIGGPLVVAVTSWTSALAASPFERLRNPAVAGTGLSPILEHWAMLVHPPLLYLGLALALLPAVVTPRRAALPLAKAAAVVLTAALALGAGWAYVELGWGGWWAWDPVENVALIPWLLLVVVLHVGPRYPAGRTAALAVWPAVLAGTAMTRTSLRTSVHAFANATELRWWLWPLTAAVTVWAVTVAVSESRSRSTPSRSPFASPFASPSASPGEAGHGRARALNPMTARAVAAAVVGFAAVVVALGTFRPFVPGESTAGWFYTRSLYPVTIAGLVALGVVPRLARRRNGRSAGSGGIGRIVVEAMIGAVLATVTIVVVARPVWYQVVLAAALGAGAVTVVTTPGGWRAGSRGRTLAHLGMVAVLAGTLGGTAASTRTVEFAAGATRTLGTTTVTNLGSSLTDDDPPVIVAEVELDGTHRLRPAFTVYPDRGLRLPEVATHSRPWEDLQVVLRSADDAGGAVLTVNVQPLTQAVWLGAVLTGLGLAISGVEGRRGAPAEPSTTR